MQNLRSDGMCRRMSSKPAHEWHMALASFPALAFKSVVTLSPFRVMSFRSFTFAAMPKSCCSAYTCMHCHEQPDITTIAQQLVEKQACIAYKTISALTAIECIKIRFVRRALKNQLDGKKP